MTHCVIVKIKEIIHTLDEVEKRKKVNAWAETLARVKIRTVDDRLG